MVGRPVSYSKLRFGDLCFRDQLLIWVTRAWITASGDHPTMPSRVREAFHVAGIPQATRHLHELLTMMATSGCKDIHFQPVPCQHISDDELHFLLLLNAAGQGASEDYLLELLMEWLPPVSAARALAFVRELAFSVFTRMKSDSASKSSSYIPATVYLHGHCPDPGILRVH